MPEEKILERFLDERRASARIACPPTLVPAPGQYLLAHNPASDDPLAVPVFSAGEAPEGFLVASPMPSAWSPNVTLALRGPLGHGFALPPFARRVALAALDVSPAYLLGLIPLAQRQDASICLVCDEPPEELSMDVEIRPLAAFAEISTWADYLALAVSREAMREWRESIRSGGPLQVPRDAQVLVVTSMPCGGLAECGVCSVSLKTGEKLVCKDGPVLDLK
jgi:dihydroorotate dehydrogenase electron transfer subunit